ncbi:MAG: RadC family protein [Clostridia bacterium]|nr:RadC family protein [Clostridia bacterium]
MAGIHDGHRDRLRNKIRRFGFEALEDHEKLEYLLFPFIPRRDTNAIAHELLLTFGSYKKALDADAEVLSSVKGMTENAALFLHLLPEAFSAYLLAEKEADGLTSPAACAAAVIGRIGRKKEEHFLIYYLSETGKILKSEIFTRGQRKAVSIDRDNLVATAAKCGATYVVLGHNHPNGNLAPSDADIDSTNRIAQALGMVGIKLADHLIVSEYEYHSMRRENEIVDAVDLSRPIGEFAEDLLRREIDVDRIKEQYRKKP